MNISTQLPTAESVILIETGRLKHIEGFSARRVAWLAKKIEREGFWRVPLAVDRHHGLVMDGQHRMEVARLMGLHAVPAILFSYGEVEVWSLRPGRYTVSAEEITARALSGDIYPYKTAKHRFPCGALPSIAVPLRQLHRNAA